MGEKGEEEVKKGEGKKERRREREGKRKEKHKLPFLRILCLS